MIIFKPTLDGIDIFAAPTAQKLVMTVLPEYNMMTEAFISFLLSGQVLCYEK